MISFLSSLFLKDRKQRYVQRRRKMLPSRRGKNCWEYITEIFSGFGRNRCSNDLIFGNNFGTFCTYSCINVSERITAHLEKFEIDDGVPEIYEQQHMQHLFILSTQNQITGDAVAWKTSHLSSFNCFSNIKE